jgi:HK97 family phage prohead protease
MERSDFLSFEHSAGPARRAIAEPLEFRRADDGKLVYRGYASTTEEPYPVYGGEWPGWTETITRGAFKKTLSEHAFVQFLINHDPTWELASTRAGTLKLSEDTTGLLAEAQLNPNVSHVRDLYELNRDGHMREMSFGFQVVREEWSTADGERADNQTGTHRTISEVNMNHGDVSAVSLGANSNASGGFRAELVLAELRDGRVRPDALAELARAITPTEPEPEPVPEPEPDLLLAAFTSAWDALRDPAAH